MNNDNYITTSPEYETITQIKKNYLILLFFILTYKSLYNSYSRAHWAEIDLTMQQRTILWLIFSPVSIIKCMFLQNKTKLKLNTFKCGACLKHAGLKPPQLLRHRPQRHQTCSKFMISNLEFEDKDT